MGRHRISIEEQLASGVVRSQAFDGCWGWLKSFDSDGYAQVCSNYKILRVARLMYEFCRGKVPKGKHILHTCDNPSCVNPLHLYIGDSKQNVKDKVDRNRQAKGSRNGNAKLTEEFVKAARKAVRKGVTRSALADRVGVNSSTIGAAVAGKTWAHVT